MTPAKLPFGIGERVAMHALYCDVVAGKYCQEVRLRGTVDGQMRTIYLGPTTEAVTALHTGGALASLDVPTLAPGAPGAEIALAHRELLLERQPVAGTRRSRLLVQVATLPPTNGAPAVALAPTPANGAGAPPGAAAAPVAPAAPAIETKRAAITASFRAALVVTSVELLPAFTAAHLPADADTLYKLGFSLWRAWLDAGLVA